jgi:hypothetical protein
MLNFIKLWLPFLLILQEDKNYLHIRTYVCILKCKKSYVSCVDRARFSFTEITCVQVSMQGTFVVRTYAKYGAVLLIVPSLQWFCWKSFM